MPKKVMGFFGTREGAGCTHMALSVANYLHSVEKWEVMYLELGDFSHLYPMFSDRVVEKSGDILYAYQGVFYLICPKEKEALRLLDAFDGMMVIDFGRFAKENPLLESICQRRVLMGGLQPWEREAYATCIEKNKKKSDMAQMEYYSRHVNRKSQVSFAKENGVWVRPMPDIADPFSLEEKDIYYLKQWLQK